MKTKIKIMLVDDHPLVREWLANLINEEPDLKICGVAGNIREALDLIGKLSPQVIIVDIAMKGGSGLELIKNVKEIHPKTQLIVLSMHDEIFYAERAMRAGAAGYVMKSEATAKVLIAIRAVLEGGLYFSDAVNGMIVKKQAGRSGRRPPTASLSDRELEIYQLLGHGHNTRQISEELHLGYKTVHAYLARIREKLNVANINEMVFQAVRWNESQQP